MRARSSDSGLGLGSRHTRCHANTRGMAVQIRNSLRWHCQFKDGTASGRDKCVAKRIGLSSHVSLIFPHLHYVCVAGVHNHMHPVAFYGILPLTVARSVESVGYFMSCTEVSTSSRARFIIVLARLISLSHFLCSVLRTQCVLRTPHLALRALAHGQ